MHSDKVGHDPVEALAAEFMERLRQGASPSIEEYAQQHPELADEIRDLFPTIAAVEQWKLARTAAPSPAQALDRPAVLGDFRIVREIGRGGMGIVYEAEQESLGRRVAVKVLPRGALLGEKQRRRFEREARTAARLHHTNIVPVFGVGEQDGVPYYVMQYIRGAGLDLILAELHRQLSRPEPGAAAGPVASRPSEVFAAAVAAQVLGSGRFGTEEQPPLDELEPDGTSASLPGTPLAAGRPRPATLTQSETPDFSPVAVPPIAETRTPSLPPTPAYGRLGALYWKSIARLGLQVADALQYAHSQGILHRDIKPANLLLDAKGTVWVTDFGLAKAWEQPGVTDSGDLVGTLMYMAPEQFEGKYDARSDVYSLGVTLCELLTLQPLFQATNKNHLIRQITQGEPRRPRRLNPKIPRDLETITLKAMARDPGRRYPSAAALLDDLQNYLEDRPIRARRVTVPERLGRWCRRNKALAAVGGVALALLLLVAITASVGFVSTRNALQREEEQRQRAEKTAELAVEALEKVFAQLAPQRVVAASELTFAIEGGEAIELPLETPVSRDNAVLLEQLLVFYGRLAAQEGTGHLRGKQALASRRVGDIYFRLGQFEQSEKAYEQAATIYRELEREAPQDPSRAVELARVYNALGQVHWKRQQYPQARHAYQAAVEILELAAPEATAPEPIQYELAQTYFLLGTKGLNLLGPPPGPPGPWKPGPPNGKAPGPNIAGKPGAPQTKAPPPAGPAGGKFPGRPGHRGRGMSRPDLAALQAAWSEGPKYLQKAVTLLEGLVQAHPNVPAYRHLLALSYRATAAGQPFAAPPNPAFREKAIQILRRLVQHHPEVPDYRHDLSETLADVPFWWQVEAEQLEKSVAEALTLSRDLVQQYPNIPDYRLSAILIYERLGMAQKRSGALAKAETTFRQALELQEFLVRQDSTGPRPVLMKAKFESELAEVLRGQNKLEDAVPLLRGALARLERVLAKHDELGFFFHFLMADNYDRLSAMSGELGDTAGALAAKRQAAEHRRFLAGKERIFPPGPER